MICDTFLILYVRDLLFIETVWKFEQMSVNMKFHKIPFIIV